MTPFLKQVAETFYREEGTAVSRNLFVFPNRRSGLFFQRYLASLADRPLFSPQIATISELFGKFTSYRTADRIGMLFRLYRQYIAVSGSEEPFDEFLFWGEMLLNDFDDVDKYLVDARQLFTNVRELREIDELFDYLSPDQLAAVRRFWTHFRSGDETPNKERFMALWKLLYPLYFAFREELAGGGEAYEGMIFREVAERARAGESFDAGVNRIVFVGLNVLTEAERELLKALKKQGVADFYWDYQSPCVQDPDNKASFFVRQNRTLFPSRYVLPEERPEGFPEIELIGVPSLVGQAKQGYRILEELLRKGFVGGPEHSLHTAVVLPQEELLMPVLYSVPPGIGAVNVTMGYGLANTPVAALIDGIYELQKLSRVRNGETQFYHRTVSALLSNRYVLAAGGEAEVARLGGSIRRNNRVYPSAEELAATPFLETLFVRVEDAAGAVPYLLALLSRIEAALAGTDESETGVATRLSQVEREFLYHYYVTVQRIGELLRVEPVSMQVDTFFRLLKKMVASVSIPFQGEPLSGLQVMGVLETRALDFENLIVFSVNEGIFPQRQPAGSFIPYNLRKGFGLSTAEHQESIYAYYFYRMIYRAKRIWFLYDTRTEGMQTGEVSRYLRQLEYLYRYPLRKRLLTYDIAAGESPVVAVPKNERVQRQLARFLEGGESALSASALNTYIDCPLQFYLKYVEGLREEEEVTERIEASTFGSIVHEVMERIYDEWKGGMITEAVLQRILADESLLTRFITEAFARHFFRSEKAHRLTGQNYLTGEIVRKYVRQVLRQDMRRAPFRFHASEQEIDSLFSAGGRRVRLKAFLDRIDEKEGVFRIVDYKTGHARPDYRTMEDLFDRTLPDRPKSVLQLFLYVSLYRQEHPDSEVVPGLYSLKTIFDSRFDWHLFRVNGRIREAIESQEFFETGFRDALTTCLSEIFDPEIPFGQTDSLKVCGYCPFASICKR